jgi:hypothetical protein
MQTIEVWCNKHLIIRSKQRIIQTCSMLHFAQNPVSTFSRRISVNFLIKRLMATLVTGGEVRFHARNLTKANSQ